MARPIDKAGRIVHMRLFPVNGSGDPAPHSEIENPLWPDSFEARLPPLSDVVQT